MTPFQLIVVPLLGFLAGWNLLQSARVAKRRKSTFVVGVIWLAAAACVLRPSLLSLIAAALGIGRGADLVFYIFSIIFLILTFYVYNRLQQLDSALTNIVRHLALREASDRTADDRHDHPDAQRAPNCDEAIPKE